MQLEAAERWLAGWHVGKDGATTRSAFSMFVYRGRVIFRPIGNESGGSNDSGGLSTPQLESTSNTEIRKLGE